MGNNNRRLSFSPGFRQLKRDRLDQINELAEVGKKFEIP